MCSIEVSVVIVCMNNLRDLYPCLYSIQQYTHLSYEVLVSAYKFSHDNLQKVKNDFPWVKFIESNECRGFSENNNLALRQVKGEYCFILNDDTVLKESVIDSLVDTIKNMPEECAVVSPNILNFDGSVQCCGLPPNNWIDFIGSLFKIKFHKDKYQKYYNQNGIFKSFNIMGAAFLIKTGIFKSVNFFDEIYFFSPEDWALSTLLNKKGYSVFVNSDIHIFHRGGGSFNVTRTSLATYPAFYKGNLIFYSGESKLKKVILILLIELSCSLRYLYWKIASKENGDKGDLFSQALKNTLLTVYKDLTPKQIFQLFYK